LPGHSFWPSLIRDFYPTRSSSGKPCPHFPLCPPAGEDKKATFMRLWKPPVRIRSSHCLSVLLTLIATLLAYSPQRVRGGAAARSVPRSRRSPARRSRPYRGTSEAGPLVRALRTGAGITGPPLDCRIFSSARNRIRQGRGGPRDRIRSRSRRAPL